MRGVSHDFLLPSGQTLRVLEQVDLDVRANEVLALLGPSGCGKSTILRILGGLIHPTLGAVEHRQRPLTGLNPQVAMVFQGFALYPWLTARQNIEAAIAPIAANAEEASTRAAQAIKLVGLSGFADSYPREMSGGMKQRIGIARAIAVDRELLFMDEPFSQVDALTAESLRAEVLELWAPTGTNPSSIVMVSHDIKEVVYMADRIVVLGAHPGRIRSIVENRLPRPRDYRSVEFLSLVDHIHDLITGHELPDQPAPVAPTRAVTRFEPLPDVRPGLVLGLLEYLAARRGQEDIFRIAQDTAQEFGQIITVVRAAEVLDLVDTPKRQVVLTAEGRRIAEAHADGRRALFRAPLLALDLFRHILDTIKRQEDHRLDRDFVDELLVMHLPQEDHQRQFDLLVAWARFAELFTYDEATESLTLMESTGTSGVLPAATP
jgi:NitT/TauT family transport system ATP-binding protein